MFDVVVVPDPAVFNLSAEDGSSVGHISPDGVL